MKHLLSGELNSRAVPTTEGLSVALYLCGDFAPHDWSRGFKIGHQKLIVAPGTEDILHHHKHTYEMFTVEEGGPTAIVNDIERGIRSS